MSNDNYINKGQAVFCDVLESLAAGGFPELSQGEIVKITGHSLDKVFRALRLMHTRGYVEKHSGDRYRLSQYWPKLGNRYGKQLFKEAREAQQQFDDFRE